jgi:hypothetical protein
VKATAHVGEVTITVGVMPADTTGYGVPVTRSLTIKQGMVGDLHQYELIEDGEVLWHGLGDDPVEGLLRIIIRISEGEDPTFPSGT